MAPMSGVARILRGAALAWLLALTGCAGLPGLGGAGSSGAGGTSGTSGAGVSGILSQFGLVPQLSAFTATRAEIAAAGITVPLLKVVARQPRLESAGYLLAGAPDGIEIYRDLGGGELYLDQGVLRASVGQRIDLLGAETAHVLAALAAARSGETPRYSRLLRHRAIEGPVIRTRVFCEMRRAGAESVTILGLTTPATRFDESCRASEADALGRVIAFENRYWRDASGAMVASEQWLNGERGALRIEQVQR
ncbi:MAG: YjbF family lipoprotein [Pseudomonadota bacterium]